MKEILLKETEFKNRIQEIYREETILLLEEKWEKLTGSEKKFIIEFVKEFTPKKSYLIKESWMNTIGDIVGIFDPTGVVDLINGISYLKQGDTLFGVMSLISAVPLIGDVVGKPVVLGLKAGGEFAKTLRGAKMAGQLASAGAKYPIFKRLLAAMSELGPKLKNIISRAPFGIGKRFSKTVDDWVSLLTSAKNYKAGVSMASTASKLTKNEFKLFRDFGMKPEWGWWMRVWKKGGFFGKNRQLSRMLGNTKFYLGLLDTIGIGNFVGPDELIAKMGEENFNKEMEKYMQTPEAKKYWESEMSNIPSDGQTSEPAAPPTPPAEQKKEFDIMDIIIPSIF